MSFNQPKKSSKSDTLRYLLDSPQLVCFTLLAVYLCSVTLNAWTGDDSFITFRTVDNFIHGYGLRWNIEERVQSFTHPLWACCLIVFSIFSSDIFLVAITFSILISLAAFSLVVFNRNIDLPLRILAALALICSKAFVEYSTSGLENPLTHLLLVLFFLTAFHKEDDSRKTFKMIFIVALLATNRIDSILIPFPLLALRLLDDYRQRGFKQTTGDIVLGSLPFLCWETFSIFYYGFLAPNTAYAKLGASQSHIYLIQHGMLYLVDSLIRDPGTLLGITAGGLCVARSGSRVHLTALAGPALYLLYVIYIGGDFMSGRFLTGPLIASLIIGVSARPSITIPEIKKSVAGLIAAGVYTIFLAQSFVISNSATSRGKPGVPLYDICDEAHFYGETNSLISRFRNISPADHRWAKQGQLLRHSGQSSTVVHGNIGMLGYYAGPRVTIIDYYALSDPLLARLPARHARSHIGHFERDIPEGYVETLASRSSQITDRNLNRYYERLALITKGDLYSIERLKEILKFNSGAYNKFRELYSIGYSISRLGRALKEPHSLQYPCVNSYAWEASVDPRQLPECGSPTGEKSRSPNRIIS